MLPLVWLLRLLRDVVHNSIANRAYAFGFSVLVLLFLGLLILAAEASAPFIYTLF